MKAINLVLIFVLAVSFSQEAKKLALVIGNADYAANPLENPVNDARLIGKTLDSLGFDVDLKENLSDNDSFLKAINDFGNKVPDYDVGFVYYSGHAVQIDGINYLLPTDEVFKTRFNVKDYGVDVEKLLRHMRSYTDKTFVLVLDACRDNPFESNWNRTRSLGKGSGLAEIPPPAGSIIAFSTSAGKTADDTGNGTNSYYTSSLSKNLLVKDVSLDQVFRNVRADVLKFSQGVQRPAEYSQLTGDALVLNPSTFDLDYSSVNDIGMGKGEYAYDYDKAMEIVNILLYQKPSDQKSIRLKIETYLCMGEYEKGLDLLNPLIEKFNKDDYLHYLKGLFYQQLAVNAAVDSYGTVENNIEADISQKSFEKSVSINPENPLYYYALGDLHGSWLFGWNTEKMLYYASLSKGKKDYSRHENKGDRSYFFEERLRDGRSDDGGLFKKTEFSVVWAYNLIIKAYMKSYGVSGDKVPVCNEINGALDYLLENEEKYDALLTRLEQGVDKSLMYLQDAINSGEEYCAKYND